MIGFEFADELLDDFYLSVFLAGHKFLPDGVEVEFSEVHPSFEIFLVLLEAHALPFFTILH